MKPFQPSRAGGRWFTMTLAEQLGNVGSEYERALTWKQRGEKPHFEKAFDRMLELLDLTIADQRWRNHRLKELTRLRTAICEEFYGESTESTDRDLRNYFLSFGLLARKDR
ncbi:MAG: hypothetical protein ACRD2L_20240 [Terriglobia bacterium]